MVEEIKKAMEGAKIPSLHTASMDAIELSFTAKQYGTIQQIVDHITKHDKTFNVRTESLRVNGEVVQDEMKKYLGDRRYGSGALKKALKSELHILFDKSKEKAQLEKIEGEKSHFKLGEYLHQCILEPTKFSRVVVEPEFSKASHAGCDQLIEFWAGRCLDQGITISQDTAVSTLPEKKEYIQRLRDASGLACVSESDYLKIQILKKHYEAYGGGVIERLLKNSKREISLYGERYKIRPDAMQFEENIGVNAIISVKSTAQEDLRGYMKFCAMYNYDLAEAFYLELASKITGRNFNTVINIVLQTVEPYGVAVVVYSQQDLEVGYYKMQVAKEIFERCLETGVYRSYDMYAEEGHFGLIESTLPAWNGQDLLNSNT
jgi:hypothetical protein